MENNSVTTKYCCADRSCPVERSFCEMEHRLAVLRDRVDSLVSMARVEQRARARSLYGGVAVAWSPTLRSTLARKPPPSCLRPLDLSARSSRAGKCRRVWRCRSEWRPRCTN